MLSEHFPLITISLLTTGKFEGASKQCSLVNACFVYLYQYSYNIFGWNKIEKRIKYLLLSSLSLLSMHSVRNVKLFHKSINRISCLINKIEYKSNWAFDDASRFDWSAPAIALIDFLSRCNTSIIKWLSKCRSSGPITPSAGSRNARSEFSWPTMTTQRQRILSVVRTVARRIGKRIPRGRSVGWRLRRIFTAWR